MDENKEMEMKEVVESQGEVTLENKYLVVRKILLKGLK